MVNPKGFTLLEVLIGITLTTILLMGISAAYRTIYGTVISSGQTLPLSKGVTAANTFIRDKIGEASCIQWPAPGNTGSMLIGWVGQDCSGEPLGAAPPTFFLLCVDSANQWRYRETALSGTPSGSLSCEASGSITLPPNDADVAASFSRPSGIDNRIDLAVSFTVPARKPYTVDKAMNLSTSITIGAPIESP